MSNPDAGPPKDDEIVINGKKYCQVHVHRIFYSVSAHKSRKVGSLVDRGADGGIAGDDVRIIEKSDRTVDVRGIDNHQITNIPIVTARGVIKMQQGPTITILHQYAYTGQGYTPAVDSGATIAQVFVGVESLVTGVYAIEVDWQFINTLEDQIQTRGALTKLISNRAQVEISNQVKGILQAYCINVWQSKPHYQHQNFAERRIQQLKTLVNTIMDRVGTPPHAWFLCLQYVTFPLNSTYSPQLKCTPSLPLLVPQMILVCCYTSIFGNRFIFGMGSTQFFRLSPRKVADVLLVLLSTLAMPCPSRCSQTIPRRSSSVLPPALPLSLGSRT